MTALPPDVVPTQLAVHEQRLTSHDREFGELREGLREIAAEMRAGRTRLHPFVAALIAVQTGAIGTLAGMLVASR